MGLFIFVSFVLMIFFMYLAWALKKEDKGYITLADFLFVIIAGVCSWGILFLIVFSFIDEFLDTDQFLNSFIIFGKKK